MLVSRNANMNCQKCQNTSSAGEQLSSNRKLCGSLTTESLSELPLIVFCSGRYTGHFGVRTFRADSGPFSCKPRKNNPDSEKPHLLPPGCYTHCTGSTASIASGVLPVSVIKLLRRWRSYYA
jgi:hypothetical protein